MHMSRGRVAREGATALALTCLSVHLLAAAYGQAILEGEIITPHYLKEETQKVEPECQMEFQDLKMRNPLIKEGMRTTAIEKGPGSKVSHIEAIGPIRVNGDVKVQNLETRVKLEMELGFQFLCDILTGPVVPPTDQPESRDFAVRELAGRDLFVLANLEVPLIETEGFGQFSNSTLRIVKNMNIKGEEVSATSVEVTAGALRIFGDQVFENITTLNRIEPSSGGLEIVGVLKTGDVLVPSLEPTNLGGKIRFPVGLSVPIVIVDKIRTSNEHETTLNDGLLILNGETELSPIAKLDVPNIVGKEYHWTGNTFRTSSALTVELGSLGPEPRHLLPEKFACPGSVDFIFSLRTAHVYFSTRCSGHPNPGGDIFPTFIVSATGANCDTSSPNRVDIQGLGDGNVYTMLFHQGYGYVTMQAEFNAGSTARLHILRSVLTEAGSTLSSVKGAVSMPYIHHRR